MQRHAQRADQRRQRRGAGRLHRQLAFAQHQAHRLEQRCVADRPQPHVTSVRPVYKRYALAALTAVYTLNLVDRGPMMLLLQPIKDDLQLNDTSSKHWVLPAVAISKASRCLIAGR